MSELPNVLARIVEQRRQRLQRDASSGLGGRSYSSEPGKVGRDSGVFMESLLSLRGRAVIAEVKMGSPRLGSLAGRVDPERQAKLYADNGAAALSVVVEPDFFLGSYELLQRCRRASGLPTLAKDFVIDVRQLEWAREAGADAVLLIAAILSAEELQVLAQRARLLGLTPLVECHSLADLEKLADQLWEMVGVNNRDLTTFEVSLPHSIDLLPNLPAGALRVAESGIQSGTDVAQLAAAGFDAFLVGESLLLADDPAARLRELVSHAD